jgi:hypothetical protein
VRHDGAMASDLRALDPALAERGRVMRTIRDHEAELRALGVAKPWLFGSLALGDGGRRSDVDVLISVPPTQKISRQALKARSPILASIGLQRRRVGRRCQPFSANRWLSSQKHSHSGRR